MSKAKVLKSLYNGIMNDHSIQRYSIGWKDIVKKIERKYKSIKPTAEQFENKLISNAFEVAEGTLRKDIETFAKELSFNLESLSEKPLRRGNHRSPFGIGA